MKMDGSADLDGNGIYVPSVFSRGEGETRMGDKSLSVVTMFHNMRDRDYNTRCFYLLKSLIESHDVAELSISIVDTTPGYEDFTVCMVDMSHSRIGGDFRYPKIMHSLSVFNKSRALNHGLSLVKPKYTYTMFTDIDFIFHPNAIKTIVDAMSEDRMVLGIASYLAKTPEYPFDWDEIVSAPLEKPRERKLSPGTIQVAPTSWFRRIGGYDESYEGGLGGMDDEMKRTAMEDGLELYWIEEPLFFHCPHPRSPLKGKCSHIYHGKEK